jgi:hypothetical protein
MLTNNCLIFGQPILGRGTIYNYRQRAGIADGGEFYIRPPGTAAWLLIKLDIKTEAGLYSSSPEPQHSRITAGDCANVKPHYWQYQCVCPE